MSEDLGLFQVVCPVCSRAFDLDETVIQKVWSQSFKEGLKVICPACGCQRCSDLPDDEEE
jgi:hypothetical protein